jgi:hypothetical protein
MIQIIINYTIYYQLHMLILTIKFNIKDKTHDQLNNLFETIQFVINCTVYYQLYNEAPSFDRFQHLSQV